MLISSLLSCYRDFSKEREFGREASSVGDVSSMKPKTVCAFYYCLHFPPSISGHLCAIIYFFGFFYQKFYQKPQAQACQRTLIALDKPTYYFCFFNYSRLRHLIILALFINKNNCLSSDTLVDHEVVYREQCPLVLPSFCGQEYQILFNVGENKMIAK